MNPIEIRNQIFEIIKQYRYELNTKHVRDHMCVALSAVLQIEVIDETTPEMIDKNQFYFSVMVKDKKYSMYEYLDNMIIIQRKLKLEKIKNNIINDGKNN